MPESTGSANPFGSSILGPLDQSPRSLRARVQLLLTSMLVGTNLLAAILVVLIATFLVPSPSPTRTTWIALAIAVPTYVGFAVIVGATFGTAQTVRGLRWALDGREPSERDREQALLVPLRLTQMQAFLWLSAAVLFGALSLVLQPERVVSTVLTVAIAGAVVCGIGFLLTEWALRPIAARALADQQVPDTRWMAGVGGRAVIFWTIGTAAPLVGLVIGALLSIDDDTVSRTALVVNTLVVSAAVMIFGLIITVLNARSVVAPLQAVRRAQRAVEEGDFEQQVVVYNGTEIGVLQAGFNRMAAGLREREHLRDVFGRHVGHEVAARAVGSDSEIELGGQARTASVLFIDLVGSTGYATEHDPIEVVEVLNRFFSVVVEEVDRRDGLVNKFMGDAVLAIFGTPVALDDHAGAALGAARAMAARLAEEVPEVGAGIGVATGEVVAGNVGAQSRFEFTVIGDAVNSASRLTDLAKERSSGILATCASVEATRAAGGDEADHWRAAGSERLRGRDCDTEVAEPV